MLTHDLADADIAVAGHFVADIALAAAPVPQADGSILVELEALTIAD